MCGITGFWVRERSVSGDESAELVKPMLDALERRGPDSAGWSCEPEGVVFGHRRLAIIDLSPAGHQPMVSHDGRYLISLNGEIYNYRLIRQELDSLGKLPALRGSSDTEILLAAIEAWGLEGALARCNGMFAFALWDRRDKRLHLVRDRLGKKPLYHGVTDKGDVVFGSELKALRTFPGFRRAIDQGALALYLRYGYIPAPHTIYESAKKVRPGTIVTIGRDGASSEKEYWSVRDAVERGLQSSLQGSREEDVVDQLETLLKDAVGIRMISDVPLGAFLSGGIDSSLVVALMQSLSSKPVKTFTIGFHEENYNEAKHAKEVARHLGTDHTELYVTPTEAMDVIPMLPRIYDEPFADSSQIPTYLVSHLARTKVTVALSGDGGDEVFAGYTRYITGQKLWHKMSRAPMSLRKATAASIKAVTPRTWNRFFGAVGPALPPSIRFTHPGDKLHKLADTLNAKTPLDLYQNLVSLWRNPRDLVLSAHGGHPDRFTRVAAELGLDPISTMMYLDMVTYLPDDILAKVDRANMAVSLEGRAPLLDYRVLEFGWRLPLHMKLKDGKGKWPLRQILYRHVPRELIERPKMGFGVPIDSWLRGPLKAWADDLLSVDTLKRQGLLAHAPIQEKWREHLDGGRNWQHYLWNILMFQAWMSESE